MYTMKEVCQIVGWSYETLKYYLNTHKPQVSEN